MNTTTEKVSAIVQNNTFVQLLAQLHGGLTATEAADGLKQLVEAVKKSGKKGSIKLLITVTPDGKGEVQSVETTAKIAVDLPRKNVRPTVFFVNEDHTLTREDPNQREIDFEREARPPGVAKAAAAASR